MLQTRAVGPLDKRRKVTRCLGCAKRHIKCEGGFPCAYCIQKDTMCVPQQETGYGMTVFVHQTQRDNFRGAHRNSDWKSMAITNKQNTGVCLMNFIRRDQDTCFLDCFVSFIQQNMFTMNFPSLLPDLLPLIPKSPVLYHAVMAIGALDANRHSPGRVPHGGRTPRVDAISSYHTSLVSLQSCLGQENVMRKDDVLWATFFLGLFELLSDDSGEGWVKHMLYGTSKMLQLAGPSNCMSSLRRAFYDLFRVLEASRALLYNEETILSKECWLRLHKKSLCSRITTQWEPMEEILTLMIQTSAFSFRARAIVEKIPELERCTNPPVAWLGAEGLKIQETIYNWHTEALLQLFQDGPNTFLDLALLYYHALLIFLSGNYDYFPYWDKIPAPVLSPAEVFDHLIAILELSDQVLFQSKIPGVVLFFPLTVAGSRARHVDQRSKILSLLDQVFRNGFVVANRVREGLLERWAERDRRIKHPVMGSNYYV
ncbi:fungal-specific transcription factor domain-containing protein [Aspergillus cavernicola]|uniref:Fungal-specific transcription factor domain-containing protein n=1 Tax=Aspergillus cavernicola TaxID=176166 RepID=A0ABR4HEW4_9EURO